MAAESTFKPIRNTREWYVACLSSELRKKPLKRTVLDNQMALFRNEAGEVGALQDRCPHRNVELSLGNVVDGTLECVYHGWRFDHQGVCRKVPGLAEGRQQPQCTVPTYPTRELDGLVWVYPNLEHPPETEPFDTTEFSEGFQVMRHTMEMEAPLHAIVENFTDCVHPAYLHRGIFRQNEKPKKPVTLNVTRTARSVSWEFLGQEPLKGLVPRLLGSRDGVLLHTNSFIMPGITRGDWRIGEKLHVLTSGFYTPITDFRMRLFGEIRYKGPVPLSLAQYVLMPQVRRILAQDYEVLESQSKAIRDYGSATYRNTEVDTPGVMSRRLMEKWAKGQPPDDRKEREFSLSLQLEL